MSCVLPWAAETRSASMDNFAEIQAARREFDQVVSEIQQLPEYSGLLAEPTVEDVMAASDDRPLCYVIASESDGLALIAHNNEITHVELPTLTTEAVQQRARSHLDHYRAFQRDRAAQPKWSNDLDNTTQWLWDAAMGAVLNQTDATEMVIVPGGLLGLLPLHAAWYPDQHKRHYAIDDAVISYIPNARSLTVAKKRAAALPANTLLAVADPRPTNLSPLDSAGYEAAGVAAMCAASTVLVGTDATAEKVRPHLSAQILHFACHGVADLLSPSDSHLVLAGTDRIALRDLLTMNLQARLAVLSACETSMPGTDLPDEALALPTGLLQSGAAGVIASLWAVHDLSTAVAMLDFYRRWQREGRAPAAALRDTQIWLRDSTNAEKAAMVEQAGLPTETYEYFLDELQLRDNDDRDEADVHTWAAFAYFGA